MCWQNVGHKYHEMDEEANCQADCHWSYRWLVLDTDSKDLVTVHTDGNEQLSVMSYGPGVLMAAHSVSSADLFSLSLCYLDIYITGFVCMKKKKCSQKLYSPTNNHSALLSDPIQMATSWPLAPTTTTSISTPWQKTEGSTVGWGNARWAPVFLFHPHLCLSLFYF